MRPPRCLIAHADVLAIGGQRGLRDPLPTPAAGSPNA